MHAALIKYSHRKLGLRSNASGQVPDRQPASQPRKLFGHADSNKDRQKLLIHPSIHSSTQDTGSTETHNYQGSHALIHPWVSASLRNTILRPDFLK